MKRVLAFLLISATRMVGQAYDFSAATAQLQSNLGVYGSRVVVIVEQRELGEVFRFESGVITQDSKIGIASCTKWLSGAVSTGLRGTGLFPSG